MSGNTPAAVESEKNLGFTPEALASAVAYLRANLDTIALNTHSGDIGIKDLYNLIYEVRMTGFTHRSGEDYSLGIEAGLGSGNFGCAPNTFEPRAFRLNISLTDDTFQLITYRYLEGGGDEVVHYDSAT